MADYLLVPKRRQDRLVHQKARQRPGEPLPWFRVYRDDLLGDPELAGESPFVRFVSLLIEAYAQPHGWRVKDDARLLAGRLGVSPKHLRPAIDRLVEIGRLHRLTAAVALEDGSLQMRLSTDDYQGLEGPFPQATDPEPIRNRSGTNPERIRLESRTDPPTPRSEAAPRAIDDSAALPQSRAEQREKDLEAEQSPTRLKPDVVSDETETLALPSANPILNRLIARACQGEKTSASIIRYEAEGLPDAAIARTLESLIARRPRPANPAGYVVNTLRSIRTELGAPRDVVAFDREPEV